MPNYGDVVIWESEGSSEGTSDGTGTPSDDSKLSRDIESKTFGNYDGFLMPKSHDDDFEDHLFFSKNQPSFQDLMSKANRFTWVDGSNMCTSMTYDEYGAHIQWLDELKPARWNDPNFYKEHSAEVCHEWFPVIQEQFPKMADYELVETMAGFTFVGCGGGVAHINFKAKHKNVGDSSLSVYFAEIAMTKRKVTCFTELHIDPSSGTDGGYQRRCSECHPKKPFPYAGYVYHPVNEVTWVEGCLTE